MFQTGRLKGRHRCVYEWTHDLVRGPWEGQQSGLGTVLKAGDPPAQASQPLPSPSLGVWGIQPAWRSSGMSAVPGEELGATFIIIVEILLKYGRRHK